MDRVLVHPFPPFVKYVYMVCPQGVPRERRSLEKRMWENRVSENIVAFCCGCPRLHTVTLVVLSEP